jgi:hypothetical protein
MTLDVYAGLFGDDLDAVADRLDGLPGRLLRTRCGLTTRRRAPAMTPWSGSSSVCARQGSAKAVPRQDSNLRHPLQEDGRPAAHSCDQHIWLVVG